MTTKLEQERFHPRRFIVNFVNGTADFHEDSTPPAEEYLSLAEHKHLMAEKDDLIRELQRQSDKYYGFWQACEKIMVGKNAKIERLREAAQELIDEIDGQAELGGPTFDDGKLRAALQEDK